MRAMSDLDVLVVKQGDHYRAVSRVRWSRFFGPLRKVYSKTSGRHWNDDETATPVHGELQETGGARGAAGGRPVQAIAAKHEIHPNQVGAWKRQAIEGLEDVFAGGRASRESDHEATLRDLHAKIGELTVERDFLVRGLQR